SLTGHLQFQVHSAGELNSRPEGGRLDVHLIAATSDLNYSNQPGTTVGQNVTATVTGTARRDHGQLVSDLQLRSPNGQVLAGAVLLDFAKNPLSLQAHVEPSDNALTVTQIRINQTDLIDAQGDAQIALRGPVKVQRAHLDVNRLEFAAA